MPPKRETEKTRSGRPLSAKAKANIARTEAARAARWSNKQQPQEAEEGVGLAASQVQGEPEAPFEELPPPRSPTPALRNGTRAHCDAVVIRGHTFCAPVPGGGASDARCVASEQQRGGRTVVRCAVNTEVRKREQLVREKNQHCVAVPTVRNGKPTGGKRCLLVSGAGEDDEGCSQTRPKNEKGGPALCYRTGALLPRGQRVPKGAAIELVTRAVPPEFVAANMRFCVSTRSKENPSCAWQHKVGPDGMVVQQDADCEIVQRRALNGQALPPRCVRSFGVGACVSAGKGCKFDKDAQNDRAPCYHVGQGVCASREDNDEDRDLARNKALARLRARRAATARVCRLAMPSPSSKAGARPRCKLLSVRPLLRMPVAARTRELGLCQPSETGSGRCVPTKEGRKLLQRTRATQPRVLVVAPPPPSERFFDKERRQQRAGQLPLVRFSDNAERTPDRQR